MFWRGWHEFKPKKWNISWTKQVFLTNQRSILLSLSNSLMTSSHFLVELTWIDKVIPSKIKSEKPSHTRAMVMHSEKRFYWKRKQLKNWTSEISCWKKESLGLLNAKFNTKVHLKESIFRVRNFAESISV